MFSIMVKCYYLYSTLNGYIQFEKKPEAELEFNVRS